MARVRSSGGPVTAWLHCSRWAIRSRSRLICPPWALQPAPARSRFDTVTNETKIILGSTIGTVLTTAIGLAVLITTLFVNLGSRIEALREDMREDYQRLDDRMRTVEQGFAKIDQRLATLERAVIPAAEPAE